MKGRVMLDYRRATAAAARCLGWGASGRRHALWNRREEV
jgi:hypothetical protein